MNTDATHFAACSGTIRLEGCTFAGSEDDGVNVHSYYYDPEPLGDRICLLRVKSPTFPHPQVIDSPRPGEELTLYDRDTLAERGRFLVREAEEDRAELAGDFCRGCGYCLPCPQEIDIPTCARMKLLLGRSPVAGNITPKAQAEMAKIDSCLHCNQCASRCPYGLDTPKLLEENLAFYREFMTHYQAK